LRTVKRRKRRAPRKIAVGGSVKSAQGDVREESA